MFIYDVLVLPSVICHAACFLFVCYLDLSSMVYLCLSVCLVCLGVKIDQLVVTEQKIEGRGEVWRHSGMWVLVIEELQHS